MGFDLRSTEKNIQLYNQLSGRAGRFSKDSIVVYQTFNPSDETLKNIIENEVLVINGCHQYALSLVGRCPYGVWDSSGTDSEGEKGTEWSHIIENTLYIFSNHSLSNKTITCFRTFHVFVRFRIFKARHTLFIC